jgi:hypothetical protein
VEATLDIIGAEIEALKALLLQPQPLETATAQYRQLARLSHEMCEKLVALQDAESATQLDGDGFVDRQTRVNAVAK